MVDAREGKRAVASEEEESKKAAGEAEKEEAEPPEDADQERPTVAPPFDPVAFAREVLHDSPPSNPHTKATPAGGFRPPAPTYTDSEQLEAARQKSLEMVAGARHATPSGALSLVNTRIPSNLPPGPTKPPARTETLSGMNPVDREWSDLEVATRPPPAGQNPEDFDIPSQAPLDLGLPTPEPAKAERKSLREQAPPTKEEMLERVALGDYTGALEIAEKLLASDPSDDDVLGCAENCRSVLRQMYTTKIGPLDRVPVVMVPRDQLRWLSIDHRAGFVLSLVDGVSSLEMILDVSGMPELDALRILSDLAQQRIISFR